STRLAGVSPWVWFLIAGLAAFLGAALLLVDHGRRTAHQRERRRWAALRGWRFVPSDPVLADRWRHGVISRGGAGIARNLVIGSLFTPVGRRPVQIFDHEQSGKISTVVAAVRRRFHAGDLVVEMWLPDRPAPQDPGMRMLGPVGPRYVFGTDLSRVRPLITPELIFTCNEMGEDIPVVWLEQDWVLAAAPPTASPARLELLLRAMDAMADQLDLATGEATPAGDETAEPEDKNAEPDDAAGSADSSDRSIRNTSP
ncbi:MAG TPA: hypothetical protein VHH34_17960, partial [Pseudonocardiaceae bacterium]|nr:hypothetical protein [Pseudonocardiaceae bacterium]